MWKHEPAAARIEAGDLLLPENAPWLTQFLHELLEFPKARYKDQADALVHLLASSGEWQHETIPNAGPELGDPDEEYYGSDPGFDPWILGSLSCLIPTHAIRPILVVNHRWKLLKQVDSYIRNGLTAKLTKFVF